MSAVLAALAALVTIPALLVLMKVAPLIGLCLGLLFMGLLAGSVALFLNPAKHYFESRN